MVLLGSIARIAVRSCFIAFGDLVRLVCQHVETFLMDSLCFECLQSDKPSHNVIYSQAVQESSVIHTLDRHASLAKALSWRLHDPSEVPTEFGQMPSHWIRSCIMYIVLGAKI